MLFSVTACSSQKNTNYYQHHPDILIKEVVKCNNSIDNSEKCQQLKIAYKSVRNLGEQLQRNPQDFGKNILLLQQEIALQENKLQLEPQNLIIKEKLKINKQKLQDMLSIVRWLEAPE